jgi:hypothetical protein
MAKEVVGVTRETRQPHELALEKEFVEIECDDGSEYVFERTLEREGTAFRLARRVKPDGTISTSKVALPAAVKESIEASVNGWYK